MHNFEYIYFPRGVVHALTRISGILYTCLTFRIKVSSSTMEVEVHNCRLYTASTRPTELEACKKMR